MVAPSPSSCSSPWTRRGRRRCRRCLVLPFSQTLVVAHERPRWSRQEAAGATSPHMASPRADDGRHGARSGLAPQLCCEVRRYAQHPTETDACELRRKAPGVFEEPMPPVLLARGFFGAAVAGGSGQRRLGRLRAPLPHCRCFDAEERGGGGGVSSAHGHRAPLLPQDARLTAVVRERGEVRRRTREAAASSSHPGMGKRRKRKKKRMTGWGAWHPPPSPPTPPPPLPPPPPPPPHPTPPHLLELHTSVLF